MTALAQAQLSELIGSIYDRAIDPGAWSETLARMRVALGAENAALSLVDLNTSEFLLNFVDNIPDQRMRLFGRPRSEVVALWGGADLIMSLPLDEPVILSRINPAVREGANRYRDDFAADGFADAMSLGLVRDAPLVGSCVFGRIKGAGRFREEEIALARLLLPHAQRAMAFSRLFELATLRANAFEAALEAAAVPTILVTSRCGLIHANSAGHAELERGRSLRRIGDNVEMTDRADGEALAQALATASADPNARPAQLTVKLSADAGQLELLPLPRNSERGMLAPSAAAAMVLTGPKRSNGRDDGAAAEMLIERYGLTRSEAAVALEIAKGDGRAAAAARLGIRDNTVRTHLSAIFLKLDINRQAQLVRLIDGEAGADLRVPSFRTGPHD